MTSGNCGVSTATVSPLTDRPRVVVQSERIGIT